MRSLSFRQNIRTLVCRYSHICDTRFSVDQERFVSLGRCPARETVPAPTHTGASHGNQTSEQTYQGITGWKAATRTGAAGNSQRGDSAGADAAAVDEVGGV